MVWKTKIHTGCWHCYLCINAPMWREKRWLPELFDPPSYIAPFHQGLSTGVFFWAMCVLIGVEEFEKWRAKLIIQKLWNLFCKRNKVTYIFNLFVIGASLLQSLYLSVIPITGVHSSLRMHTWWDLSIRCVCSGSGYIEAASIGC